MKDFEDNAGVSPESSCSPSILALQCRLDGDASPESEEVVAHRAGCQTCREYVAAAARLTEGLQRASHAAPRVDLADRILAEWHRGEAKAPTLSVADQRDDTVSKRSNRRRLAFGFATAAAVFIAVVAIRNGLPNRPEQVRPGVSPVEPVVAQAAPVPLRDSFNEAAATVATLTKKTTNEAAQLALPSLSLPSPDPLDTWEPVAGSFTGVGHSAAFGLAPITDSAKRAASLLWRELGPDSDRKPEIQ